MIPPSIDSARFTAADTIEVTFTEPVTGDTSTSAAGGTGWSLTDTVGSLAVQTVAHSGSTYTLTLDGNAVLAREYMIDAADGITDESPADNPVDDGETVDVTYTIPDTSVPTFSAELTSASTARIEFSEAVSGMTAASEWAFADSTVESLSLMADGTFTTGNLALSGTELFATFDRARTRTSLDNGDGNDDGTAVEITPAVVTYTRPSTGDNTIQDGTNHLAAAGAMAMATAVDDKAPPTFTARTATVTTIAVTFSEAIHNTLASADNPRTDELSVTNWDVDDGTPSSLTAQNFTQAGAPVRGGGAYTVFTLTLASAFGVDATPTVTYVRSGPGYLSDALTSHFVDHPDNNEISDDALTAVATDGIGPAIDTTAPTVSTDDVEFRRSADGMTYSIRIPFSEALDRDTVTAAGNFALTSNSNPVTVTSSYVAPASGQTTSHVDLALTTAPTMSASYSITIAPAVTDVSMNAVDTASRSFTVELDLLAPTVSSAAFGGLSTIVLSVSEPLDTDTVQSGLTVTRIGTADTLTVISAANMESSGSHTVLVTTSAAVANARYTLTVPATVTDDSSTPNALAAAATFTVTAPATGGTIATPTVDSAATTSRETTVVTFDGTLALGETTVGDWTLTPGSITVTSLRAGFHTAAATTPSATLDMGDTSITPSTQITLVHSTIGTGVRPVVEYEGTGTITASGAPDIVPATASPHVTATDGIAPFVVTATYGTDNTITLTFSEGLASTTAVATNFEVRGFAEPSMRSATALALDTNHGTAGVDYTAGTTSADPSTVSIGLDAVDTHEDYKVVISALVTDTNGNAYVPVSDTSDPATDNNDIDVEKDDTTAPRATAISVIVHDGTPSASSAKSGDYATFAGLGDTIRLVVTLDEDASGTPTIVINGEASTNMDNAGDDDAKTWRHDLLVSATTTETTSLDFTITVSDDDNNEDTITPTTGHVGTLKPNTPVIDKTAPMPREVTSNVRFEGASVDAASDAVAGLGDELRVIVRTDEPIVTANDDITFFGRTGDQTVNADSTGTASPGGYSYGYAYIHTVVPTDDDGMIAYTLTIRDRAGNLGSPTVTNGMMPLPDTIDATPPTIASARTTSTTTLTVTLSEAVIGAGTWSARDGTTTAAISSAVPATASDITTMTLTYAAIADTSFAPTVAYTGTGIVDAGRNALESGSDADATDGVSPTAEAEFMGNSIVITFSEPVTGTLTPLSVTPPGGSASDMNANHVSGASTVSIPITGTPAIGTWMITIPVGVTDIAANPRDAASATLMAQRAAAPTATVAYEVQNQATGTAKVSPHDNHARVGDRIVLSLTLSEAVDTAPTVLFEGATMNPFTMTPTGTTNEWAATYTVPADAGDTTPAGKPLTFVATLTGNTGSTRPVTEAAATPPVIDRTMPTAEAAFVSNMIVITFSEGVYNVPSLSVKPPTAAATTRAVDHTDGTATVMIAITDATIETGTWTVTIPATVTDVANNARATASVDAGRTAAPTATVAYEVREQSTGTAKASLYANNARAGDVIRLTLTLNEAVNTAPTVLFVGKIDDPNTVADDANTVTMMQVGSTMAWYADYTVETAAQNSALVDGAFTFIATLTGNTDSVGTATQALATPPMIDRMAPSISSAGFTEADTIVITLSEALAGTASTIEDYTYGVTANSATVTLATPDTGDSPPVKPVAYDADALTITLTLAAGATADVVHTVTLPAELRDTANNAFTDSTEDATYSPPEASALTFTVMTGSPLAVKAGANANLAGIGDRISMVLTLDTGVTAPPQITLDGRGTTSVPMGNAGDSLATTWRHDYDVLEAHDSATSTDPLDISILTTGNNGNIIRITDTVGVASGTTVTLPLIDAERPMASTLTAVVRLAEAATTDAPANTVAAIGDDVLIRLTASEALVTASTDIVFFGRAGVNADSVTAGTTNMYTYARTIVDSDDNGALAFVLTMSDIAGNTGTVTQTALSPNVTVDADAPTVTNRSHDDTTRTITLTFNEGLDSTTIVAANFEVFGFTAPLTRSAALALDATYDDDGVRYMPGTSTSAASMVLIRLSADDTYDAYKVVIDAAVTDTVTNAYVPISNPDGDADTDDNDVTVQKRDTLPPMATVISVTVHDGAAHGCGKDGRRCGLCRHR